MVTLLFHGGWTVDPKKSVGLKETRKFTWVCWGNRSCTRRSSTNGNFWSSEASKWRSRCRHTAGSAKLQPKKTIGQRKKINSKFLVHPWPIVAFHSIPIIFGKLRCTVLRLHANAPESFPFRFIAFHFVKPPLKNQHLIEENIEWRVCKSISVVFIDNGCISSANNRFFTDHRTRWFKRFDRFQTKKKKKAAVNCREIQDALLRRNWVQLWEGSRYAPERKWEQKNIENERERERGKEEKMGLLSSWCDSFDSERSAGWGSVNHLRSAVAPPRKRRPETTSSMLAMANAQSSGIPRGRDKREEKKVYTYIYRRKGGKKEKKKRTGLSIDAEPKRTWRGERGRRWWWGANRVKESTDEKSSNEIEAGRDCKRKQAVTSEITGRANENLGKKQTANRRYTDTHTHTQRKEITRFS